MMPKMERVKSGAKTAGRNGVAILIVGTGVAFIYGGSKFVLSGGRKMAKSAFNFVTSRKKVEAPTDESGK